MENLNGIDITNCWLVYDGSSYIDKQGNVQYYRDYEAFEGLGYYDKNQNARMIPKDKIPKEIFEKLKKMV